MHCIGRVVFNQRNAMGEGDGACAIGRQYKSGVKNGGVAGCVNANLRSLCFGGDPKRNGSVAMVIGNLGGNKPKPGVGLRFGMTSQNETETHCK